MHTLIVLALTFAPLFVHTSNGAWGADGHRLVCEIAFQHLSPEAKVLVAQLRTGEAGTFAESCTWADEVRDDRPETYNYHFINIPAGQSGMRMTRDCGDPAKRCGPWAIKHYATVLADRYKTRLARREALKFLGHFVGDLHQPLHAGRPADLGGNRVLVSFFGDRGRADRPLNLHSVWDSRILGRAGLEGPQDATQLIGEITTADVSSWANSDVVSWANESYRIDEEFVYSVANGSDIGQQYYDRALGISKRRIQQAGIRLAHVINEAARGRTSFTF
jgi:hypothetical protein